MLVDFPMKPIPNLAVRRCHSRPSQIAGHDPVKTKTCGGCVRGLPPEDIVQSRSQGSHVSRSERAKPANDEHSFERCDHWLDGGGLEQIRRLPLCHSDISGTFVAAYLARHGIRIVSGCRPL